MNEAPGKTVRLWRLRVLVATWLSYAGFYVCRKNFPIVKSSVLEALELTKTQLAHLFSAYLVAYTLGQFLSGYLGTRVSARRLRMAAIA